MFEELKGGKDSAASRQVKLRHADQEIRLARDPFPLFPGEALKKDVTPLTVVPADSALRLRASLDFQACAAAHGPATLTGAGRRGKALCRQRVAVRGPRHVHPQG